MGLVPQPRGRGACGRSGSDQFCWGYGGKEGAQPPLSKLVTSSLASKSGADARCNRRAGSPAEGAQCFWPALQMVPWSWTLHPNPSDGCGRKQTLLSCGVIEVWGSCARAMWVTPTCAPPYEADGTFAERHAPGTCEAVLKGQREGGVPLSRGAATEQRARSEGHSTLWSDGKGGQSPQRPQMGIWWAEIAR